MKPTLLFGFVSLPAILATLQLIIVAKEDVIEPSLSAMMNPGESQKLVSPEDFLGELHCLDDNKAWTPSCDGRFKYRQIGQLNFTEVTKEPRPMALFKKDPIGGAGLHRQCYITTLKDTGYYVWESDGGFDFEGLGNDKSEEAVQIKCEAWGGKRITSGATMTGVLG